VTSYQTIIVSSYVRAFTELLARMFRRLLGWYTFRYCSLISTFGENVLPSSSGIEDVNFIAVVKAYPVHRMMYVSATT
jgi:hypothetical protein